MGNGIKQRRSQPLTFTRSFGPGNLLDRSRSLDGYGDQAANRLQSLLRESASFERQYPERTDTHANRNETHLAVAAQHKFGAGCGDL